MLRATCVSSSVSCSVGSGTAGVICVHLSHRLAKSCTLGAPQIVACNQGCLPAAHTPRRLLCSARAPRFHLSIRWSLDRSSTWPGECSGQAGSRPTAPLGAELTLPGLAAAPARALRPLRAPWESRETSQRPSAAGSALGHRPGLSSPRRAARGAPSQPAGGHSHEGHSHRGVRP